VDRGEKEELLKSLYEKLDKLKSKKDKHFLKERADIKKQIKEVKFLMTDEDWKEFMEERSEINTSKC